MPRLLLIDEVYMLYETMRAHGISNNYAVLLSYGWKINAMALPPPARPPDRNNVLCFQLRASLPYANCPSVGPQGLAYGEWRLLINDVSNLDIFQNQWHWNMLYSSPCPVDSSLNFWNPTIHPMVIGYWSSISLWSYIYVGQACGIQIIMRGSFPLEIKLTPPALSSPSRHPVRNSALGFQLVASLPCANCPRAKPTINPMVIAYWRSISVWSYIYVAQARGIPIIMQSSFPFGIKLTPPTLSSSSRPPDRNGAFCFQLGVSFPYANCPRAKPMGSGAHWFMMFLS